MSLRLCAGCEHSGKKLVEWRRVGTWTVSAQGTNELSLIRRCRRDCVGVSVEVDRPPM